MPTEETANPAFDHRLRERASYDDAACSICGAPVDGADDQGSHTMLHDLLVVMHDRRTPFG